MTDSHCLGTHVHGMYKQYCHIYYHGAAMIHSLKQLSWKTAMLLALTRPPRSADLSQLSLCYKPEGVAFVPSSLAKQSRQGKPISEFFFPSFPHDPGLCPVVTLKVYEEHTAPNRTKLFLALRQLLPVP